LVAGPAYLLSIQSNALKSYVMLFNLSKDEAKIIITVECDNAEQGAKRPPKVTIIAQSVVNIKLLADRFTTWHTESM
jgi:hypothetical protein